MDARKLVAQVKSARGFFPVVGVSAFDGLQSMTPRASAGAKACGKTASLFKSRGHGKVWSDGPRAPVKAWQCLLCRQMGVPIAREVPTSRMTFRLPLSRYLARSPAVYRCALPLDVVGARTKFFPLPTAAPRSLASLALTNLLMVCLNNMYADCSALVHPSRAAGTPFVVAAWRASSNRGIRVLVALVLPLGTSCGPWLFLVSCAGR